MSSPQNSPEEKQEQPMNATSNAPEKSAAIEAELERIEAEYREQMNIAMGAPIF